jgi:hypothetical protein
MAMADLQWSSTEPSSTLGHPPIRSNWLLLTREGGSIIIRRALSERRTNGFELMDVLLILFWETE